MHSCVGIGLLRSYHKAYGNRNSQIQLAREEAKQLFWWGVVAELVCILYFFVPTAAIGTHL